MANSDDARNTIYRSHLVDSYLKRVGSFRRLFSTLLGFTAAFGFLIAWPYLSAVQQEVQLAGDIQKLDTELAQTSTLHNRYQQPHQVVQQLQQMIKNGPPMLRDYIESISSNQPFSYHDTNYACRHLMDPTEAQAVLPSLVPNIPAQLQQQSTLTMQMPLQQATPAQHDSCTAAEKNARSICRVDRFVQLQLCEYEQLFSDRVLPALAALQDGGANLFNQAELEQQFNAVRKALYQHVAANPTFWHTYQGKGEMSIQLQKEVERLWSAIAARMTPVINDLDQRISNARKQRDALKANSDALMQQREELTTRLTRIQSPIGNLPIGLTESVLLFPIVLSIGFGMAIASLLEQLRLRRTLCDAEQTDTGGNILTSDNLAKVAPLWIEPTSPGLQRLAHWLLLLVPLLVCTATIIAVLRIESGQTASLLQQAAMGDWVYELLYFTSGMTFAVCLWLMWRSLRGLTQPN